MVSKVLRLITFARQPRARRLPRAGSWAALCVLYVVGWLAHGLHMSQSSHEVCEHGAVEHVGSSHGDERVGPERAGADGISLPQHDEPAGPRWSPGGDGADEPHHHCAMATPTAVVGFEWVELTAAALPQAVDAPRITKDLPRVPREPVFALAPHHSPPVG